MALAYSVATRNAMLDTITTAIGSNGLLRIYDGSRPATKRSPRIVLVTTSNSPFVHTEVVKRWSAPKLRKAASAVATFTADAGLNCSSALRASTVRPSTVSTSKPWRPLEAYGSGVGVGRMTGAATVGIVCCCGGDGDTGEGSG